MYAGFIVSHCQYQWTWWKIKVFVQKSLSSATIVSTGSSITVRNANVGATTKNERKRQKITAIVIGHILNELELTLAWKSTGPGYLNMDIHTSPNYSSTILRLRYNPVHNRWLHSHSHTSPSASLAVKGKELIDWLIDCWKGKRKRLNDLPLYW